METKKQAEETKPIETFGTAPSVTPSVKQSNYSGIMLKDRYLIEGELGRGGIGVVYLARDTQLLQRRVVIKVLLESSENSLHTPWFRKKFDQEIEALVRIDHPGVVGVLDVGAMPDGKPFFVMQYVEGTNLRTVIEREMQGGKLDLARVAHFVRQIGLALTAAHDKGIIHRDLKPENVMVQRSSEGEEVIKLIDFGIATVKDSQANKNDTGKTKVAGALPYMAPEQLRGEPLAASDTWSLGVMAYEMLTGLLPFNAETLVHLHDLQRQGPNPLPSQLRPDLPPAAEQVLLRALAFAPEARHLRARDFGDAFAEALLNAVPRAHNTNSVSAASAPTKQANSGVPTAILPPAPAVARPASGKSPLPYFALVVVLAALTVGSIGYWKARQAGSQRSGNGNGNPGLNSAARELNYSLSVRMKKNAGGAPVELAGEIIFQPGDELRVKLNSPQEGYLYIIGEGPKPDPQTNLPQYNLLFPSQSASAQVVANQSVFLPSETGPGFFVDAEVGSEKIWLIWSQNSLNQLEQLRKWYNDKDKGAINDAAEATKVRDFLQTNETARPIAEKDPQQMRLKGRQVDLLIYPIVLAHY